MARDGLLIGEVAAKSGVSRKALRLYEKIGILPPSCRALATTLRERTSNSYTAAALDVILKATPQQLPRLGQATETKRTLTRLLGEAVKR